MSFHRLYCSLSGVLQLIADFSRVEPFEFIMLCSVCIRVLNKNALNGCLFHFNVLKIIVSSLNAVERILLHWLSLIHI